MKITHNGKIYDIPENELEKKIIEKLRRTGLIDLLLSIQ